jgi:hypothetical protein
MTMRTGVGGWDSGDEWNWILLSALLGAMAAGITTRRGSRILMGGAVGVGVGKALQRHGFVGPVTAVVVATVVASLFR